MSAYGISSDEVAEDYRKALEDLTMNSRYEISNLTVIAKENTEHALAISEALKNHIKRVRIACHNFAFLLSTRSLSSVEKQNIISSLRAFHMTLSLTLIRLHR
jgi:hypothetical protein